MSSNRVKTAVARAFAARERERGQAFVEYVLLLTLVAMILAAAYTLFAGDIANALAAILRRIPA